MSLRTGALLLALGLTVASAAFAQGGAAESGVRFGMLTWAQVAISGDAPTDLQPGGRLVVDGPIAVGSSALGRMYARLDLTAAPGAASLDFASPQSFGRAAELSLGAYHTVGRLDVGEQAIRTSLVWEWGFSTALEGQLMPRYIRHYAGGVRLEERTSGASLSMLYGRHEAGGRVGHGQALIFGQVPLGGVKSVVFGGDAVLSVGPKRSARDQRDVLRLWVAVSLPDLVEVFTR